MENSDIIKSSAFKMAEILDYSPNSVIIKSIIAKITGNVSVVSFDAGEILNSKISPFDTLIQIIEGKAEIIIDDNSNLMETGQSIIIPAHSRNTLRANLKFKMLSTTIKSGYEGLI